MSRRVQRIASMLSVIATVAEPAGGLGGASDGSSPVSLEWKAPPECPDAAYVLNEVTRIAGSNQPLAEHRVRAWATVHPSSDGYQLVLVTDTEGGRGHRLLAGATCASVADAAAVILALVLNPDSGPRTAAAPVDSSATEEVQPPTRQASEVPAIRSSPPPPTVTQEALRSPANVWRTASVTPVSLRADVLGALVLGRLPVPSPTVGGSVGVRMERVHLALVGAWGPDRSSEVDSDVSATFSTRQAGLMACYLLPFGEFGAGACAEADHLWVQGKATGTRIVASPKDAEWSETWLGSRFEWGRRVWTVSANAEIGAAWPRQTFLIDGLERPAHKVGPVLGRFTLTGGVRF